MADGQFDIRNVGRSEIAASPPGPNHWCIFADAENGNALTKAEGDPAVFTVLYEAPLEITAPQIVANTDDWAPDDIEVANVIRMYSDAPRLLTGIDSTNLSPNAKRKLLINVGSYPITLKDQGAGSSGVNRFLLLGGSSDITLNPGDAQEVYYDDTDEKWRSV